PRDGHFLRGPDANLASTLDWGDAAVVHLSGHASGHAGFAPLAHFRLNADLLLAHDVMHRSPPPRGGSRALLAACGTGARDFRARDECMGLMTAFLLRGAGLVLATQWSVIDYCAAEFVLFFLEQVLDRHSPPAMALRLSQCYLRGL